MVVKQWHGLVFGRVQRVGFRFFTKLTAMHFGIKGFVSNQADGSVEIVAVGEEEALKQFVEAVSKGNFICKIDRIIGDFVPATLSFKDFSVR